MKHLITWFVLGACLLLLGCQESADRRTAGTLPQSKPLVDFCNEVDAFHNEKFAFSPAEDVKLFQAKLESRVLKKTRVSGKAMCEALGEVSPSFRPATEGATMVAGTFQKRTFQQ